MSKPIPYGQGVTFCHLTSCGNCSAYAAGDSHKPYGVDGLFPVQRTAVIIEPFGTDKSVPYANTGKCTIQRTAQKSLPIGMHKCIPYENSVNAPYAALS